MHLKEIPMARTLRRVLLLSVAAAMLFAGVYRLADSPTGARAAGVGGPVILGGDDLTDHGSVSGGDAQNGWLYIQRAIENIGPNVTRAGNDGSIAALGSAAGSVATSGDAGAAIDLAGSKTGRAVTHYEGPTEIDTFFTELASAAAKPAIIHLAGTGASNDFDSTEETAITAHATEIAAFVSSGGGLLSHGTFYDWLTALLPGATTVSGGGSGDLYFTADGLTDLPSLTVSDINAGPWHNRFEGDLGGLKVLVRSSSILDSSDANAAVIIGGSQVTFETPTATNTSVPTSTNTPVAPTNTPTPTNTSVPTSTNTPVAPTNTPTPTNTAVSTATSTPTSTPTVGAGACPASIDFGIVYSCAISVIGEVNRFTFPGAVSDRMRVRITSTSGLFVSDVEIYDPDGTTRCSTIFSDDTCSLTATGQHTLLIGGSGTGTYNLYVQRLNDPLNCTPVGFGVSLSDTISPVGELGCFTFPGAVSDRMRVRITSTSGLFVSDVEIYDPDGTTRCSTIFSDDTCSLTATGQHTLLIGGSGTGTYNLYVQRLNDPLNCVTLVPDVLAADTLMPVGKLGCYVLDGTGGEEVNLRAQSPVFINELSVYDPDGSDRCSTIFTTLTCALVATGRHTLLVGGGGTGSGDVCLGSCATPTPTFTSTPTNTPVGPTNTPTPTNTSVLASTNTPTSTPTNTPVGPTNTPTPTNTSVPTPTNTPAGPTNTPTPTNTAVLASTNTPTSTPTNTPVGPTNTPTPTNTSVPTSTNTPVAPTNTPTPTNTAVPDSTNTPTNTPTLTPTSTPLAPTNTPTPPAAVLGATLTPLATNTAVPTATNTPRPTRTLTPPKTSTPLPTVTTGVAAAASATPAPAETAAVLATAGPAAAGTPGQGTETAPAATASPGSTGTPAPSMTPNAPPTPFGTVLAEVATPRAGPTPYAGAGAGLRGPGTTGSILIALGALAAAGAAAAVQYGRKRLRVR